MLSLGSVWHFLPFAPQFRFSGQQGEDIEKNYAIARALMLALVDIQSTKMSSMSAVIGGVDFSSLDRVAAF